MEWEGGWAWGVAAFSFRWHKSNCAISDDGGELVLLWERKVQ